MADYVSSLTGVAMDMALQDMAEHNSEAWAVGQRNGNPVTSDDVTYHNNAQYYAQQAQSIAPASVTEAVRWDVAQTALTDANKEQARANIDAGKNGAWSNPNLLDNWYFVGGGSQQGGNQFPINQKEQTSYVGNQNTIDRWRGTNANSTLTVKADCITLSANTNGNGFTRQFFSQEYEGTYTFSAYIRGSGRGDISIDAPSSGWAILSSTTFSNLGNEWTLVSTTFTTTNTPIGLVAIRVYSGGSIDIKCAKFEQGSVSTLPNDAPPDYGAELAKCQRYFYRVKGHNSNYAPFGIGIALSTSAAAILIPTPVTMRGSITVSTSGSFGLLSGGSSHTGISSIAYYDHTGGNVRVNVNLSSSPLTSGALCYLQGNSNANAYIDLSADL